MNSNTRANNTKSVGHVYRDIDKDNQLCLTEKKILSLIVCMARKDKLFFMRCETIASKFNISSQYVKNTITKLAKLKYISRIRRNRIRYISIHKDSIYYRNHNLHANHSQYNPENYLQNKDSKICLHTVDKCVDEYPQKSTSQPDYSLYTILRKGHIINNASPTAKGFYLGQEINRRYMNLVMVMATKRRVHLEKERMPEVLFYVEQSLSKNNSFQTPKSLINKSLTLIQSGSWQTPHQMRASEAREELKREEGSIALWEREKMDEIASYERSGVVDVSYRFHKSE